jgi:hypothetical protein
VAGTLDEDSDGQPRPQQPVQTGDVGAHVTANENRALPCAQGSLESRGPVDLEAINGTRVGAHIENVVASQSPRQVGRQLWPEGSDWFLELEGTAGALECLAEPRSPARPDQDRDPSQRGDHCIAPRRSKRPQRGEQQLMKEELPTEDLAHDVAHGRASRAAAIAPKR